MPHVNVMPDTEDKQKEKNQTWWWLRVLVQSRSFFLNGFTSYPIPLKTSVPPTAQIRLHRILGMSLSSYVPVPHMYKIWHLSNRGTTEGNSGRKMLCLQKPMGSLRTAVTWRGWYAAGPDGDCSLSLTVFRPPQSHSLPTSVVDPTLGLTDKTGPNTLWSSR